MGGAGLLLLPALWHLGTGTSTQPPARNLSSSLTGRVLTSRNISTVTPAPGLAELPSHRHNEPDIPSSGTKEIPNESTSPSKTNIGGSSVCQTVCSVGWPATSLLSLGACVGSLVAPAITAETALTVCPAVMIAWGAAKGVFDPSLCPSLCGNMTAAARRVDSAQLTESLYDMTGLYVHPEYSVLSPAIYLARVLGGLALSLQEEHKPEDRILPGSVCEAVCSLGQPVARAAAVASCGASLRADTFTGSSFMESDLTKPSVVCPMVTLLLGVSSTLVSPALCTGTCRQVQARMPPPDDMMPVLAILAGAASLYMKGSSDDWKTIDLGATCSCWSLRDSEEAAKKDSVRLSQYSSSITAASTKYNIPAEIIMGVISRESRAGALLGKNGNEPGYGDNNNGFGLMQVDKGSHVPVDTNNIDNIDQGTGILAKMLKGVKKKHPGWSLGWQLRGAVAAYNFGVDDVDTKPGIDRGSAKTCRPCTGNYSWDTINRARWFAK